MLDVSAKCTGFEAGGVAMGNYEAIQVTYLCLFSDAAQAI
jgi:hypothetical protein